jgi:hypothetical protein
MARSYGKKPRKTPARTATGSGDSAAFKYKLRGKDKAPLDMREVQQGLLDIARDLGNYRDYRASWATFFIAVIDGNGNEILIDPKGEKVLYPYKSAADEHGV